MKPQGLTWPELVGLATLLGVGCGREPTVVGERAAVEVSVARAGTILQEPLARPMGATGVIDPESVAELGVTLDGVELRTQGSGWTRVNLAPVRLNLLALPTVAAGAPIVLGTAPVDPGSCRVRLFVSTPTIRFNRSIRVGHARFEPGVDYGMDLRIPSGEESGLRAGGECSVPAGGTAVTLLFEEGATVRRIVVTGSGAILVTPVVRLGEPAVSNQPPVAAFSVNCTGLTCNFTDASSDLDGSVVAWRWAFGDGATATAQNPSHTYGAAGTYTVTLFVTDNVGGVSSTVSVAVSVTAAARRG